MYRSTRDLLLAAQEPQHYPRYPSFLSPSRRIFDTDVWDIHAGSCANHTGPLHLTRMVEKTPKADPLLILQGSHLMSNPSHHQSPLKPVTSPEPHEGHCGDLCMKNDWRLAQMRPGRRDKYRSNDKNNCSSGKCKI